jgi:hypothetical protein
VKKTKEVKPPRTMEIVRAWLPSGQFRYFAVYSDGTSRESSKKEALQYAKAYGKKVETVLGVPGGKP